MNTTFINMLREFDRRAPKNTLTVLLIVAVGTVFAITSTATTAMAEEVVGFSPSVFSRELIDKVDHSLIGMTMMTMYNGTMSPGSGCSGVIFQSLPEENAAYALTNYHCTQGNALFEVRLWDKSTYLARLVAASSGIDTGLIRIENISPDAYEVAPLGDSDALLIGEPVLAMGGPGARQGTNTNRSDPGYDGLLHSTATMGVVMGKSTEAAELLSWWYLGKMQLGTQQMMVDTPWRLVVQAAINGGNSGGPAFNSKGECVGLNHGHSGGPQTQQNNNYTIPINFCKNFVLQILETGRYELPWFGMDILTPPHLNGCNGIGVSGQQQLREYIELFYEPEVLKVLGIRQGSPASKTDLQVGDVIQTFDGQEFPSITDLRLYIFSLPIGKEIPVVVKRGKKVISLTLTVGVKRSYDSEFSF